MECSTNNLELAREDNFFSNSRVIHLHPTLRCNLMCKHCYSSSAPNLKNGLDYKDIVAFIDYAYIYGYNALSISGGEPFLYQHLLEVLQNSQKLGYKNLVASNGMLLKSKKAKKILDHVDLIAISIDGKEKLHNEIRGFNNAYKKMLEGVEIIKQHKKDFGFIHTITPRSWELMITLADFAYESGAKLMQFHPLEFYGRAVYEMLQEQINQEILHKAFIIANYLKSKYSGKMNIQLDCLHKEQIKKHPEIIAYLGNNYVPDITELSKALKVIIVDELGDIYPVSYGFSKNYIIGNIKETHTGVNVFERFIKKWKCFYRVIEDTFEEIIKDENNDMVVWTELVVKNSSIISTQLKTN